MSLSKKKKLLFIGVDAVTLNLLKQFAEKGVTPVFAGLMNTGAYAEAVSCHPSETGTNWNVIPTGAWTGTIGITNGAIHLPGEPLDSFHKSSDRDLVGGEYFWESAEKAGKRCIMINHPVPSWHSTLKHGIEVSGGINLGKQKYVATQASVNSRAWYKSPLPDVVSFEPAEGWKNLPSSPLPPLEAPPFPTDGTKSYHIAIVGGESGGYDTVIISGEKDAESAAATLKVGQWSDWIFEPVDRSGTEEDGAYRFKLVELSADAGRFILHRTDIYPKRNWANPPEIADELFDSVGLFMPHVETRARYDDDTTFELARYQADFISGAAAHLNGRNPWDILITYIHVPDWVCHKWISIMCEESHAYDAEKAKTGWEDMRRHYRLIDGMIGKLMDQCADENTVTLIVSDHGGCPTPKQVLLWNILVDEGLLTENKVEKNGDVAYTVDWSRTKVYPQKYGYVWINKKGRDPDGVVEEEEYEMIRDRVISILHDLRDPETGESPVAVALRKEDAHSLGQWGDRIADIITVAKPDYLIQCSPPAIEMRDRLAGKRIADWKELGLPWPGHTHIHMPTAKLGICWNTTILFMHGPGVKKGHETKQPVNLVDVTPTICSLLDIPFPAQCEGRILREMLKGER